MPKMFLGQKEANETLVSNGEAFTMTTGRNSAREGEIDEVRVEKEGRKERDREKEEENEILLVRKWNFRVARASTFRPRLCIRRFSGVRSLSKRGN